MIKIRSGKTKLIHELIKEYYLLLCPKNINGKYRADSLYEKLNNLISTKPTSKYNEIYEHVKNNLEEIIIGEPKILFFHFNKLEKIRKRKKLNVNIYNREFKKIFDYGTFRKSKKAFWLGEELNLLTCPYCNRQYISIIKVKGSVKLLFDFDHYFDKASYPFLSLSFFNLIPSCSSCNSRIKHSLKFSLNTHLHPYLDSFNDVIRFSTDILNTNFFFEKSENFSIILKRNYFKKDLSEKDFKKGVQTIKDFKLKELYNFHKDIVRELVQKHLIYTESYIDDMYNNYNIIFESKADIYKMVLGNYILDSDINKRPLSKLTKDIAEEFGLLKLH